MKSCDGMVSYINMSRSKASGPTQHLPQIYDTYIHAYVYTYTHTYIHRSRSKASKRLPPHLQITCGNQSLSTRPCLV
jgi:hypothetical protein